MISIIKLWESVTQRAKSGTSGYDSITEFLVKAHEAQIDLVNVLCANLDSLPSMDVLKYIYIQSNTNTDDKGVLIKPEDYVKLIAIITASGLPAYEIKHGEIAMIKNSKIRFPSIAKGRVYFYPSGGEFMFLPESEMPIDYSYVRMPVEPKMAVIITDSADADYLVPDTTSGSFQDLEWPERLTNLMMYLILEKLGVEMKEPLLAEYANLGIQKEQITLQ